MDPTDPPASALTTVTDRTLATSFTVADLLATTPDRADADLSALVEEVTGVPAAPGAVIEPIDYAFGSPATAGLLRVRGTHPDGSGWSLFCKVLQHARHWPGLAHMPPHIAAQFVVEFPWRAELGLWDAPSLASMPAGMRAPALYRLVELGDDRAAVWQEDVHEDPHDWDPDRYARAAHLLGRWNARATATEVLGTVDLPMNFAVRMYATNAVAFRGLAPLASDELWGHPWLTEHGDLRIELRALGEMIPVMLDRLDAMLPTLPHGDASPQNLLVPRADPETFVAIDVSFRSPHALGFDLGQLLVGLVHADRLPAARLPEIAAVIVPAYQAGLAAEGLSGHDEEAAEAYALSSLLRSGFDGFRYDLLDDPSPENRRLFDERVALSRFLVEQARPYAR